MVEAHGKDGWKTLAHSEKKETRVLGKMTVIEGTNCRKREEERNSKSKSVSRSVS